MLQANELMIGDWLCYEGERNIQVKGIDFPPNGNSAYISFGAEFYPCADFSPIPITPDILARIGFTIEEEPKYDDTYMKDEYTATIKCVDVRKCNVEIEYKTYRNEITAFSHDYHNILQSQSVKTQVEYVHQLQHIMRLFGIEKEIVI